MELLAALFIAIALVWLWRRHTGGPSRPRHHPHHNHHSPWHAVEIASSGGACSAAKQLQGRRFLSREAPDLPLTRCDQAKCLCRFRHFEDRRVSDRRAILGRAYHEISDSIGQERRRRVERRRALI